MIAFLKRETWKHKGDLKNTVPVHRSEEKKVKRNILEHKTKCKETTTVKLSQFRLKAK